MNQKLFDYINNSFLSPLLKDKDITDISYNGESIFYQHNKYGRLKASIIFNSQDIADFIRQVANLSEQQFSYSSPLLDISVGIYRLNAVHGALVRVNNDKAISFSLRIASSTSRIADDNNFMPSRLLTLFKALIRSHISIVIGGKTSTGKTELQKYLLSLAEDNARIIIIDNVQELDAIRVNKNLDITSWLVNDYIKNGDFESLIRNAIRSNPDWLVIAESRGKEMSSVLNAAMTGHPLITTIHSKEVFSMPHRMGRMVLLTDRTMNYEDALEDIYDHFPIYVYLMKKVINGEVFRYVDSVCEVNDNKNGLLLLYKKRDKEDYFGTLSQDIVQELKESRQDLIL
jgi:pilus assembly protein CpaF